MPLDAHARPPEELRQAYKEIQGLKGGYEECEEVVDFRRGDGGFTKAGSKSAADLRACFSSFAEKEDDPVDLKTGAWDEDQDVVIYESVDLPGLQVIPGLLPPSTQIRLLSRLLHRDLSTPTHKTNVHTHYDVTYPPPSPGNPGYTSSSSSFFTTPTTASSVTPHDPSVHKPFTNHQLLSKKLRWVTLGGQYDWTNKRYPDSTPPEFPADVETLVRDLFPAMKAQAAIVNLYSPGDTLSLHRDVSEHCHRGLVSLSLGCDGLFTIGTDGKEQGCRAVTLRLRSGDGVYMSQQARFAWHGVPRVLAATCPSWMQDWPAMGRDKLFGEWTGWMASKRINLNVRQMYEAV